MRRSQSPPVCVCTARVHVLVFQGADMNRGMSNGMRPLHVACTLGQAEVAALLLGFNPAACRATTVDGRTPLHMAAAAGSPGVVQLLLDAGADVEARTPVRGD